MVLSIEVPQVKYCMSYLLQFLPPALGFNVTCHPSPNKGSWSSCPLVYFVLKAQNTPAGVGLGEGE